MERWWTTGAEIERDVERDVGIVGLHRRENLRTVVVSVRAGVTARFVAARSKEGDLAECDQLEAAGHAKRKMETNYFGFSLYLIAPEC